jgi:hypothetical protein
VADGPRHHDRVVPAYAFTRGRTRPVGQELPLEAVVTTTELGIRHGGTLSLEGRTIIELCRRPMSMAELGAALEVPVGVARVLVSDLAATGHLELHLPQAPEREGGTDQAILGRLLDGLRSR